MIEYRVRHPEAGLCRRPQRIQRGNPTMREAQQEDLYTHWQAVQAGGLRISRKEARQRGRPSTKVNIDMERDLGRRPPCKFKGSPFEREAPW